MARRAFWPGFAWRILAHERKGIKKATGDSYSGKSLDIDSGLGRPVPSGYEGIRMQIAGDWEFDELVIDHWLHLEQMSDRSWWLGLGDSDHGDYYHVWITITGDKTVTVGFENQND